MSKHTPGPWVPACKTNIATHRHPAILSDGGQVAIATFQGGEPATDANARLIAAAPELLEALQMLMEFPNTGPATSAARAAIAKATGVKS